ncbi:MAG: acylphosphatase [Pseudomonadales bacterium]
MANTNHFTVSGWVQGVFFRASCKQEADRLGITGWVRNLPDGRVEGMATAGQTDLDSFRDWLKQGPKMAKVLELEIDDVPLQEFDGFEIR